MDAFPLQTLQLRQRGTGEGIVFTDALKGLVFRGKPPYQHGMLRKAFQDWFDV